MTRRSSLSLVVLGALALTTLPKAAHATDFIYTITGTGGSGTGPGGAFTGANFTLTGIGNTTNTTTLLALYPAIQLTSLTYNISGVTLGDATAMTAMNLVSYDFIVAGYFTFASNDFTQGMTFYNLGLAGWHMASSIGSVPIVNFGTSPLTTDQGNIALTGWTSATFSAAPYSVTPEAPGLVQLLPGLLPLGALALRRRRANKKA